MEVLRSDAKRGYEQERLDIETGKEFSVRTEQFSRGLMTKLIVATLLWITGVMAVITEQSILSIASVSGLGATLYNDVLLAVMLSLGFGGTLYVGGQQLGRYQHALLRQQVTSALLASALGGGYDFCAIVTRQDACIVYMNPEFQLVFPESVVMSNRNLDTLLSVCGVAEAGRLPIVTAAVQGNTPRELPVRLQAGNRRGIGKLPVPD